MCTITNVSAVAVADSDAGSGSDAGYGCWFVYRSEAAVERMDERGVLVVCQCRLYGHINQCRRYGYARMSRVLHLKSGYVVRNSNKYGCWMLDTGMRGAGCRTRDAGCGMRDGGQGA